MLAEIARRGVSILLVEQKLAIALDISHRIYVKWATDASCSKALCTVDEFKANDRVRREWLEV